MPESDRNRKRIFHGWFVLAAGFFVLFLSIGANRFGVFINPMSDELGWSRTSFSLAISIGILVNGLMQPFVGRLYDRFGARMLITVSLFILGTSTMLLSRTDNIVFLIIVYGFVSSTAASGVSMVTVHSMLSKWFHRKRGIALSLSTGGTSLGSLILAPFAAYLILATDWRIAWLVLGALILFLAMPLAFMLIGKCLCKT